MTPVGDDTTDGAGDDDAARPQHGRIVEIDGRATHVLVQGSGPPLLLLAALGGNWFDLDHLADALSDRFTVVRYDRPGYGLSAELPRRRWPTLRDECDRIDAVLDGVGVAEPVLIAAHSLSTLYAEGYALTRPERTVAVLMVDGSYVAVPWRLVPTRWRVRNAHRVSEVVRRLEIPRRLGVRTHDTVLPKPPGGYSAQQHAWIENVFTRVDMLRATLVENAAFPAINRELVAVRNRLGTLPCPTTVLAALPIRGVWRRLWRRKQRRYAWAIGAQYEEISPATHLLVIDKPGDVAWAVRRLARRSGVVR